MNYIDATQLKKLLKQDKLPLILDVREAEEFEDGHIKGAVLAPWHEVKNKILGIKKDKQIVVYCATGPRSIKASKTLRDAGYKNVSVLQYGYEGWQLESSPFGKT